MPVRSCCLLLLWCCAEMLSAQSALRERAADAYYPAKKAYYAGDYATAERGYARAERLFARAGDTLYVAKTAKRRGDTAHKQRALDAALGHYRRAAATYRSLTPLDTAALADIELGLGHTYSSYYLPARSDTHYRRALESYRSLYGAGSAEVGNVHMSIGINATKSGDYLDAEQHYRRARAVFERGPPDSKNLYRVASNAGVNYRKLGDYDRALTLAETALDIKLKHYPADHPSVPKYYRNIGKIYSDKAAYEAALPYYEKTLRLLRENLGDKHTTTLGSMGELGSALADLGRGAEALTYYRRAIRGMREQYSPTHPYLVGGYFNIGRVYEDQGETAAALRQYQRTLRLLESAEERVPELIARAQIGSARMYNQLSQPDSALVLLQNALQNLSPYEELPTYVQNPAVDSIQARLTALDLLDVKVAALRTRARLRRDTADVRTAFATAERALALAARTRITLTGETARRALRARSESLYAAAVALAFQLYHLTGQGRYLHRALEISNAAKAATLRSHLREGEARRLSQLPVEVIRALTEHERRADRAEEQYADAPADSSRRALREAELAYLQLHETVRRDYPRYDRLLGSDADFSVEQLRRRLPAATALVDYFVTDTVLYVLVVGPSTVTGRAVPIDATFTKDLERFYPDEPGKLLGNARALKAFRAAGGRLHELLYSPVKSALQDADHLIIVPHAGLHRLSFEALAPAAAPDAYLLHRHAVSYAPAAGLIAAPDAVTLYRRDLLGCAPTFAAGDTVETFRAAPGPLPYAGLEVAAAARHFSGMLQLDTAARESAFVRAAPGTRVLHLATHGYLDDTQPLRSGLLFQSATDTLDDGYLSAREIYGLSLDAELAILSACRTGAGPVETGEGALSLARAFRFAGCGSVLMNRWPADDRATAAIMTTFYAGLADGLDKAEALRQAKVDYLAAADPLTAHPYFWAGPAINGDPVPLRVRRNWRHWSFLLIIPFLLGWWLLSLYPRNRSTLSN